MIRTCLRSQKLAGPWRMAAIAMLRLRSDDRIAITTAPFGMTGSRRTLTESGGHPRSPSENCFLKRAAATENRVVKTASQSSPDEARGNARRRASREQPLPLCVAFLALVYP